MADEKKADLIEEEEMELDEDLEFEGEDDLDTDTEEEEIYGDESIDPDEADESQEDETEEPEEKDDNESVPRAALIAERKKWQKKIENIKSQMESASKSASPKEEDNDDTLLNKLINEVNLDEDVAKALAETLTKTTSKGDTAIKSLEDKIIAIEAEKLKAQPEYDDIDDVKDEVIELHKKSGLSLKQAYNALYGDELVMKIKSSLTNEKAKNQSTKIKSAAKKVKMTDNGQEDAANKSTRINLTRDELDTAKFAGMTPKEYWYYKNMKAGGAYKEPQR